MNENVRLSASYFCKMINNQLFNFRKPVRNTNGRITGEYLMRCRYASGNIVELQTIFDPASWSEIQTTGTNHAFKVTDRKVFIEEGRNVLAEIKKVFDGFGFEVPQGLTDFLSREGVVEDA